MNTQIDERIKIAKSFKSTNIWKEQTQEKREKSLKRFAFLNYIIVIILLCTAIIASAMATFQTESFSNQWANAGLIVLMAMSFSLSAPVLFAEFMLQKHIKKIENAQYEFDNELNHKLENIIANLNKTKQYIYLLGLPAIFISIPALLQVFHVNPYWDKFPPFVLTVSLYMLFRTNFDILNLKRNLKQVENINY